MTKTLFMPIGTTMKFNFIDSTDLSAAPQGKFLRGLFHGRVQALERSSCLRNEVNFVFLNVMSDKRREKALCYLADYGIDRNTTHCDIIYIAVSLLKLFEEDDLLLRKWAYDTKVIRIIKAVSYCLVLLSSGGDWRILPPSKKKVAEPVFELNSTMVENPGEFSWVTLLRIGETALSTLQVGKGDSAGCQQDQEVLKQGLELSSETNVSDGMGESLVHPEDPTTVVSSSGDPEEIHLEPGESVLLYEKQDSHIRLQPDGELPPNSFGKVIQGSVTCPGGSRAISLASDSAGKFLRRGLSLSTMINPVIHGIEKARRLLRTLGILSRRYISDGFTTLIHPDIHHLWVGKAKVRFRFIFRVNGLALK